MLYLVSNPLTLPEGQYRVDKLSVDEVARMIREADSRGALESRIHFASSAAALRSLAAVDIRTTRVAGEPYLTDSDTVIEIRLKPGSQGKVGLADLEFFSLRSSSTSFWPAIVND
jgi:hypothetical protein